MGIVERPVRHGCAGDSGREYFRSLHHAHQGHVAPVAPAKYANATWVHVWKRLEKVDARDLIFDLDGAEPVKQRRLESHPARPAAAIIQCEDDITVLGQVLTEEPFVASGIADPRL